jgi:CIC family chloride channel protein
MVSESLGLTRDARHVLIAAGAAAGLSAAFNAPLSGVLFVIEEMRPQFRYGFLSFQSVLIAAVCADVVTRMGIGQAPILITADLSAPALSTLPLFLVYGGLLGVAAVMFTRTLIAVQDLFARLSPTGRLMAAGVIGATIGFAGWIDPGIVGGGYSTIHEALTVENTVGALLVLCLVRYALTLFSYGSGVPGGIFAPMLALGTLLGMAFGHGVDEIVPGLVSHPGIFAVAGMAAFFSATVRAPITGIVLTLEMTGDFGLILALLVTCLAATFVAEGLGARPIYEVLLEKTIERESGSG